MSEDLANVVEIDVGAAREGNWLHRRQAKCKRQVAFVVGQVWTLTLLLRHPLVPWPAKAVAGCTAAYLLSPIQLIPTFIPIIGQLDDLLVLYLGMKLVRKMTPGRILAECDAQAQSPVFSPQMENEQLPWGGNHAGRHSIGTNTPSIVCIPSPATKTWGSRVLKQKERIVSVSIVLFLVFLGGCSGFFVDPTLTGIVVAPPTPSIIQNTTLQLTAAGTYDDGSSKTLTGSALWSTSDANVATVSSSGILKGLSAGTSSITASSGTVSGSTTVVVTVAGLASIQVTPTSASTLSGQTQQFQAMGTLQNGQQQDITNSVTWNSSKPLVATIDATGLATAKIVTAGSTTDITATSGNIVSNTAILGVSP